jgi:hypothetical protein
MSWLFGMSKKKIAQVAPSQTDTGTPSDLSWIDEARLKIAKRKAEEKARAEAQAAAQAADEGVRAKAQAAFEVKRAAIEAANLEAGLNRYASDIKRIHPRGVEIVGAFFSDRPEVSYLIPAVRVDLSNGAQFDLELGRYTEDGAVSHWGGPAMPTPPGVPTAKELH